MKVVNWVFGSFFRTIGRTIALFVMAGIIYYLLASSGIDLKNLFLEDVKAEEITVNVDAPTPLWFSVSSWSSNWSLYNNDTQLYKTIYSTTNNTPQTDYIGFSGWDTSNVDYVEFEFRFTEPKDVINTQEQQLRYCKKYECMQYCATGNCAGMCEEFQCTQVASYSGNTIDTVYESEIQNISFYFEVENSNGNTRACTINEGRILCPTYGYNITKLNIYTYFTTSKTTTFNLYVMRNARGYKKQNTYEAITNQTQQQQQQHQEIMESNTTQAESEASNFFGNFTQSDHGGLNSIVTAPLNTINSLLTNSCTNLVLPLPFVNENITLPCMNDIYTTHFGLFFSLYQTIILAIISYRCIRSIFFDIHGFTDPDDDRIEVMDL